jgi:hypothetical protein
MDKTLFQTCGRFAQPQSRRAFLARAGGGLGLFALGDLLTGLATAKLGDDRVVLTSTKSGVTAWKLQKKE